jgi:amidohydrolase
MKPMQPEIISAIKERASLYFPEVLKLRRDLHQHPELSFQEERTSQRVKDFLKDHDIAFSEGWAGYGVVATINGSAEGPSLMMRADMDALPIEELNEVPYRSVNPGVMHACGHDVHTSSLLGTAAILNEIKPFLKGNIIMIFQPGEEKLPGGASMMINEGLLNTYKPSAAVAQHVFPALPSGHVGFREGMYMASADEIYITVHGKGGHAATPHVCIDPIVIASRIVIQLQEIISRRQDPILSGVLTIGKIYSDGGATNVIPDKVFLEGTLRTMDENWRKKAHELIKNAVDHLCQASGATAEVRIETGYPSLKNDPHLTHLCKRAAIDFLGPEKVHEVPPRMSSEDFAFFSNELPATFYRLGTGWNDPTLNHQVHSSRFNIDENAIETGMGLMAFIAVTTLSSLSS